MAVNDSSLTDFERKTVFRRRFPGPSETVPRPPKI